MHAILDIGIILKIANLMNILRGYINNILKYKYFIDYKYTQIIHILIHDTLHDT